MRFESEDTFSSRLCGDLMLYWAFCGLLAWDVWSLRGPLRVLWRIPLQEVTYITDGLSLLLFFLISNSKIRVEGDGMVVFLTWGRRLHLWVIGEAQKEVSLRTALDWFIWGAWTECLLQAQKFHKRQLVLLVPCWYQHGLFGLMVGEGSS